MRSKLPDFSAEYLRDILEYNPWTGIFIWKVDTYRRKLIGKIAGCHKDEYIKIKINQRGYYAHHLAWFYMLNEWPIQIDHKDTIKDNNKLNNLRFARF